MLPIRLSHAPVGVGIGRCAEFYARYTDDGSCICGKRLSEEKRRSGICAACAGSGPVPGLSAPGRPCRAAAGFPIESVAAGRARRYGEPHRRASHAREQVSLASAHRARERVRASCSREARGSGLGAIVFRPPCIALSASTCRWIPRHCHEGTGRMEGRGLLPACEQVHRGCAVDRLAGLSSGFLRCSQSTFASWIASSSISQSCWQEWRGMFGSLSGMIGTRRKIQGPVFLK